MKIRFTDIDYKQKQANVSAEISYLNELTKENRTIKTVVFVKTDAYSTPDNILGKAMRKARAFLYEEVFPLVTPERVYLTFDLPA